LYEHPNGSKKSKKMKNFRIECNINRKINNIVLIKFIMSLIVQIKK